MIKLKVHRWSFEILEDNIESLYHRLKYTANNVLELVENEKDRKEIYNPKIHIIKDTGNEFEFEKNQEFLSNIISSIYFNSILLVSFSLFEYSLKYVCQFIEEYSNPKYIFEDPNRDIISYCRRYLAKSGLIDLEKKEIDQFYTKLKNKLPLRNLIAHFNSNLLKTKNKALKNQENYKLFKDCKYLTVMENGQVYINNKMYIKSFIKDSEQFINILIGELKTATDSGC